MKPGRDGHWYEHFHAEFERVWESAARPAPGTAFPAPGDEVQDISLDENGILARVVEVECRGMRIAVHWTFRRATVCSVPSE